MDGLSLYDSIILLFDDDIVGLGLHIVELEHLELKLRGFIRICFDKSLNVRVTCFGRLSLDAKLRLCKLRLTLCFGEQGQVRLDSTLSILTGFSLGQ